MTFNSKMEKPMVVGGGPCHQPDEQRTPHTPTWVSLANINTEPKARHGGFCSII